MFGDCKNVEYDGAKNVSPNVQWSQAKFTDVKKWLQCLRLQSTMSYLAKLSATAEGVTSYFEMAAVAAYPDG